MDLIIKQGDIVLFQGDSVTDCGREHDEQRGLGYGYASMAAALFGAAFPEMSVQFINRGISGNRVKDLKARWYADCVELKPNIVSILIGINDCWRKYDHNDPTDVSQFELDYRDILNKIKDTAKIVLCTPFVLPYPEDRIAWREDLDPKIEVVKKLAEEFNATIVLLDDAFAKAAAKKESPFWAADGVHPTIEGHALIAYNWLKTVGAWA